ncbi:hypothetical protein [Bradyrhizobium sp. STM 3809]|uniref:hypothetical protein n=1 Tax=Bradyrhizobium sp. STM 3809 TaxID=551936 RepID=UPI00024070C1|nr:hypothetical protein [Bradyrhizobium sp. STM 3809]CCD98845.1 conserved hypothetical protein [Bradyrhizobium sp. STM 3809]
MSSLTDKNQGHQNPGQNQQGQTQGKPIRQDQGREQGGEQSAPNRPNPGQERQS